MDTGSPGILPGADRPSRRANYDANNRLTHWGGTTLNYDDNGNLILEGTATDSWNARNQLGATSLGAASYGYDAAGRRRSRTVSGISLQTRYDGWNAVQLKQSGAAVESWLFGLGLDEIYGRTNSSTSQSYLTDSLGSVLSLRNPDQSAQADYTYGAYGATTETPPGASSNLIKYTGREEDTADLYYYRNRYYSPVTDRFLSEDQIGLAGGVTLYSYVGGNPISSADPLGFCACKRTYKSVTTLGRVVEVWECEETESDTPCENCWTIWTCAWRSPVGDAWASFHGVANGRCNGFRHGGFAAIGECTPQETKLKSVVFMPLPPSD
jgi:RHS repeat-associated protein